jgi:hypothetical protein
VVGVHVSKVVGDSLVLTNRMVTCRVLLMWAVMRKYKKEAEAYGIYRTPQSTRYTAVF